MGAGNKIRNRFMELVGRTKEQAGKAVGSPKLRLKGKAKRAHGKTNRVIERTRDEVRDPTNRGRRYR
jgi:uncharacterized protein YjbJ (UPF0337 family)